MSRFDTNKDGRVSVREFSQRLSELNSGGKYYPQDWARIEDVSDTAPGSRVDQAELEILRRVAQGVGLNRAKVQAAFAQVDADGSQYIARQELQATLRGIGISLTPTEFEVCPYSLVAAAVATHLMQWEGGS